MSYTQRVRAASDLATQLTEVLADSGLPYSQTMGALLLVVVSGLGMAESLADGTNLFEKSPFADLLKNCLRCLQAIDHYSKGRGDETIQ